MRKFKAIFAPIRFFYLSACFFSIFFLQSELWYTKTMKCFKCFIFNSKDFVSKLYGNKNLIYRWRLPRIPYRKNYMTLACKKKMRTLARRNFRSTQMNKVSSNHLVMAESWKRKDKKNGKVSLLLLKMWTENLAFNQKSERSNLTKQVCFPF